MDNVFSFGASDVLHETLGGTAEGLIGNAIEKVLGKVFEGAGGGIASLFTIAADTALSNYEKEKEAEKRRIELEANHDNMSVAFFINTFGMKGVIATDENSNTVLYCYPTGTAERRIKALNKALEKKKELLVNYEFTYPITIDSLQRDRIVISKMIKKFSDREHNRIFS